MKRELDKLHLMKVFQAVAVKGSFTLAAKSLSMTVSSVSKAVKQLEHSINSRLLHRTTRSLSLTDSGQKYLISANNILQELNEVEELIHQQRNEPSGILKVSMPTALGQFFIGPRIHEFYLKYPKITFELNLQDNIEDLTDGGFDIAIRSVDVSKTSSYYSHKIGSHTKKLVASPEYTKSNKLTHPSQLIDEKLLHYTGMYHLNTWAMTKNGEEISFVPNSVVSCNNYYTLYSCALNGLGIANLYQYLVDEDLEKGNLVELFPTWKQNERELFVIYQQRRDSSPKIDVFIDFLTELFK